MPLLLDVDYEELEERGVEYLEDETQRFLVLINYPLPHGLYQLEACDILILIPQTYNQVGNDMFWTHPRLVRTDGKPIPQTHNPGQSDNRVFQDKEFCRWSRHWNHPSVVWRPGKDNIVTILRRIEVALRKPDCK